MKEDGSDWVVSVFSRIGQSETDANYLKPGTDDIWKFLDEIAEWVSNPKGLDSEWWNLLQTLRSQLWHTFSCRSIREIVPRPVPKENPRYKSYKWSTDKKSFYLPRTHKPNLEKRISGFRSDRTASDTWKARPCTPFPSTITAMTSRFCREPSHLLVHACLGEFFI